MKIERKVELIVLLSIVTYSQEPNKSEYKLMVEHIITVFLTLYHKFRKKLKKKILFKTLKNHNLTSMIQE